MSLSKVLEDLIDLIKLEMVSGSFEKSKEPFLKLLLKSKFFKLSISFMETRRTFWLLAKLEMVSRCYNKSP